MTCILSKLARRLRLPLLTLFLLASLPGCLLPGEGSRTLSFRPDKRYADYEYNFSAAYAAPSADGGYDLVMVSGFAPESEIHGHVVAPAEVPPISQIVRVHVAWRPARGSKNDYPAATNSTIQWHVFHNQRDKTPGHLGYTGAGYTTVELGDDASLFGLRDVRLWPTQISGDVHDPYGPSRVFGQVRAKNDAPAVAALLSRLEHDLEAQSAPTGLATRPSREPAGTPPARRIGP